MLSGTDGGMLEAGDGTVPAECQGVQLPELDAAEGIACQLGCWRHAARVPCFLPGGSVIGATMR